MEVTLRFAADSWVEVYDANGEKLFYDVGAAASSRTVSGTPPFRVHVANAPGVTLDVNGKPATVPANALKGDEAQFVINRSGRIVRARYPSRRRLILSEVIQAVRGMNDVLPAEIGTWQFLEGTVRELGRVLRLSGNACAGRRRKHGCSSAPSASSRMSSRRRCTASRWASEKLTLRPEATAGIARALISNGMLRGARHKLWCIGPMFRHEKPQKGRYRQFHQLDVEAVGFPGPDIDAELIAMTARLWRQLGITRVKLQLNSLGTPESRKAYRELLVAVFPLA